MSSARRLSWVAMAFGGMAGAALVLAAGVAAARVELSMPAADRLAAACRQLVPSVALSGVVVLAVLGLAGVVLARGVRTWTRALAAQRRLRGERCVVRIDGAGPVAFCVIAGAVPQAFCAGLLRPRIYVSQAALDALDERELRAVLAHEEHHRRRRDPLRLSAGAVVADAFFFVPALRRLLERYRTIAELAADDAAVRSTDRPTLARALLRFTAPGPSGAVGVLPERVDQLLGQRATWDLPVLVLAGSLLVLGLLVAVALLASAASSTVNLPMALMGSCTLVMALAVIGTLTGVIVACHRRV